MFIAIGLAVAVLAFSAGFVSGTMWRGMFSGGEG